MLRGLLPRLPDQGRQLGKACDNVIGCGAQLIDRRAGPVDPESPESERLRPARIPAVARDKAYRLLRRAKPLNREPVHGGRGLVDFPLVDADDCSDQAAQSGVLDHRSQHRRRAVREDRKLELHAFQLGEGVADLGEGRKSKVCVDEAAALDLQLDEDRRRRRIDAYLGRATFPEVGNALAELKSMKLKLAILSNGSPAMLRPVVENAGLRGLIGTVISVDQREIYKPAPAVYRLAVQRLARRRRRSALSRATAGMRAGRSLSDSGLSGSTGPAHPSMSWAPHPITLSQALPSCRP